MIILTRIRTLSFKNNPADNPKVLKDAIVDPNAIYGFRPSEDGSLAKFAKARWDNPISVAKYRADRIDYHVRNEEVIKQMYKDMTADGRATEEIAMAVNEFRNQSRINAYLDSNGNVKAGKEEGYAAALRRKEENSYERLIAGTRDETGKIIKPPKTPEEIIISAMRGNPGMDACTGLTDLYPEVKIKSVDQAVVQGVQGLYDNVGKGGSGANDIIQYERLKSQYAAEEILNADRVGSALLKDDPGHRAASYLSKEQLANGRTCSYRGGDNRIYTLLQTKGQLDDVDGIYEYIINDNGQVTHQRFIQGGKYTGFPNQKVPKGGY